MSREWGISERGGHTNGREVGHGSGPRRKGVRNGGEERGRGEGERGERGGTKHSHIAAGVLDLVGVVPVQSPDERDELGVRAGAGSACDGHSSYKVLDAVVNVASVLSSPAASSKTVCSRPFPNLATTTFLHASPVPTVSATLLGHRVYAPLSRCPAVR